MVRFEELWAQGACRATYYGFERGDHYWLYQTGYDPGRAKKSVAFVRMGLSIKEAAQRGGRYYDLSRGPDAYHFDEAAWAADHRCAPVLPPRPASLLVAPAARRQLRPDSVCRAV